MNTVHIQGITFHRFMLTDYCLKHSVRPNVGVIEAINSYHRFWRANPDKVKINVNKNNMGTLCKFLVPKEVRDKAKEMAKVHKCAICDVLTASIDFICS